MEQRPILEFLSSRKMPELAAAFRARKPEILARWEASVRNTLPSADPLTFVQLRDDIPKIIELIADALESDRPSRMEELWKTVSNHGAVRFHQSFSLAEMLVEYDLLRAAVMDEVLTCLGRKIEADEVVALNGGLDLAGRRAVLAYIDHQNGQLKAANEAQSKYLSFLSHDLRGGLNGVFLMIEVLKRELANEPRLAETINDLDVMRRSLMETVGTMDRFLHAERFRKGKVELKPGRIHLGPLLQEILSHFNYQAKDKGLILRVAGVECSVTSDRELLTMIFQNLVSNAVKYTARGEVLITAKVNAQGTCIVSIKDQGPGIAPGLMDQLFVAFRRGETHGQPGVGLGLSIASQAAQYIGAKLWAESTAGEGSTFHVELPPELPPAP